MGKYAMQSYRKNAAEALQNIWHARGDFLIIRCYRWAYKFAASNSAFLHRFYISTTNETNETSHESNETKTNGPTKPNETTDQEAIFERNRTRPISRVIILIPANGKN